MKKILTFVLIIAAMLMLSFPYEGIGQISGSDVAIDSTETQSTKSSKSLKNDEDNTLFEKSFNAVEEIFVHISTHNRIMMWVSLVLLAITFCSVSANVNEPSKALSYASSLCFIVYSISLLNYIKGYHGDVTWFCDHDEVGWFWTIVGFGIFSYVVMIHWRVYKQILSALDYDGYRRISQLNYTIGLGGALLFIIAALLSQIVCRSWYPTLKSLIIWTQVAQVVLIVYQGFKAGSSIINIVTTIIVYLIGFFATYYLIKEYLYLLLFAILAISVIKGAGSGAKSATSGGNEFSSGGYCGNCSYFDSEGGVPTCRLHTRPGISESSPSCKDLTYG